MCENSFISTTRSESIRKYLQAVDGQLQNLGNSKFFYEIFMNTSTQFSLTGLFAPVKDIAARTAAVAVVSGGVAPFALAGDSVASSFSLGHMVAAGVFGAAAGVGIERLRVRFAAKAPVAKIAVASNAEKISPDVAKALRISGRM